MFVSTFVKCYIILFLEVGILYSICNNNILLSESNCKVEKVTPPVKREK